MLAAAAFVAMALSLMAVFGAPDLILYNPSHSIPRGFYLLENHPMTESDIMRGSIVTVRASAVSPEYAALRQFTDPGDRFIKRVAATRGQVVCATGAAVAIDGAVVAQRIRRDSAGRVLPTWEGCRTLSTGQILLLGDASDSFDGRYWGPVPRSLIEGVWRPIATQP